MNSRVVPVSISHERFAHKSHRFEYRFMVLLLDLDELKGLDEKTRLFGFNRYRPACIFQQDYLAPGPGSIRDKLRDLLQSHKSMTLDQDSRVLLLTCPRIFGRVFNPVSFYFVFSPAGELQLTVAEVNNTFGDRHVYILEKKDGNLRFPVHFKTPKQFHVSPFFDISGQYLFSFSDVRREIDITITLEKNHQPALEARMWQAGQPGELTDCNLLSTWIFHPLASNMTYPRILRQAVSLYYGKGLPVFTRPEPENPLTIRTMQQKSTILDLMASRLVLTNLKKFRKGRLEIHLPDKTVHVFGEVEPGPSCRMNIHDPRFFRKIIKGEDVGLGEAYTMGMWDTDNLTRLMELLIMNMGYLSYMEDWGAGGRILHKMLVPARKMIPDNDPRGCRQNIQAHYDLSNDFFAGFLDPGMTYSCAVFENLQELRQTGQTVSQRLLQQAQERKYSMVARAAGIKQGQSIVEIGCGWGGFAMFAAREFDCRVRAVTISREQYNYVQQQVINQGLQDRIEVAMEDYRHIHGRFDALVSIEMLEAVGHKYHPRFFQSVDRLLRPGAKACIQSITIPDQRYNTYRKTQDWISTYIFPGGLLPSLDRISSVLARHTTLVIAQVTDIGPHYAPTLAAWREKFLQNWKEIKSLSQCFDEDFRRTWEYYFCMCEASFEQRHIRDLQIVLDRPSYSPGRIR